jgi:3-oxoacyl-[acyl-carrier protein] reductase
MHARKVAIITGAASGIGAATAALLAGRGFDLVLNFHTNASGAQATQERCIAAGARVVLVQGDVSQDATCVALAQAAVDLGGRIDLLVNNAGKTLFSGIDNWEALSLEQFNSVYSVNAVAAFQMVRACMPWLKSSQGNIVNVSSSAGVQGRGSSIPYLMSKGALNTLTLHLARALAPDVRVNAVCPALVTSDWFSKGMGEEKYQDLKASYEQAAPLGRANSPEDVAEAIAWLAITARTMTGELLMLDSGLHLGGRV